MPIAQYQNLTVDELELVAHALAKLRDCLDEESCDWNTDEVTRAHRLLNISRYNRAGRLLADLAGTEYNHQDDWRPTDEDLEEDWPH